MIQYYLIFGIVGGILTITLLHGKKTASGKNIMEEEQEENQKLEQQFNNNGDSKNDNNKKQQQKEEKQLTKEQKEFLEKKEQERKKEEEKRARDAKERQEKILSKLNPQDRKLMEEYFENQRKKGKSEKEINFCFILLEVFIVFVVILLCYTFYILTTDQFYSPLDIYYYAIEMYNKHLGPGKEDNIPIALDL